MMAQALLIASLVLPLLLLALLLMPWMRPIAWRCAPLASLAPLALSLWPNPISLHGEWLLLGARWVLNEENRLLLGFTSLLWLLGSVQALLTIGRTARVQFFTFFLLCLCGNIALILAHDIVAFYTGFALMSFAAYGLILHSRSGPSRYAARIYIILVILGELLLIAALIAVAHETMALAFEPVRNTLGQSNSLSLILAALLIAFGVKAGLIAVHPTLPLIYAAAPRPAATVLAGAMLNAGLIGWLYLLPLGQVQSTPWGYGLIAVGLFSAFYAVGAGLGQQQLRVLLAYSSISQMGLMVCGLGVGFLVPDAWPGVRRVIIFFALHHALAKAALFMGIGVRMKRSLWLLGLALPSLALAGAPLTSGLLAKTALKSSLQYAEAWAHWLPLVLSLTSVATAVLMIRFLFLAWQQYSDETATGKTSTPALNVLWSIALLASLLLPWWVHPDMQHIWKPGKLWNGLWPVLAAAVIGALLWRPWSRGHWFRVPPGDLLIVLQWLTMQIVHGLRGVGAVGEALFVALRARTIKAAISIEQRKQGALARAEASLARWPVSAALVVFVAVLIAVLAGF